MDKYVLTAWIVALAVIAGAVTEALKRATKPRQGAPPSTLAAWVVAWLPLVPFALGGLLALVPIDAEGFSVPLAVGPRVLCGLGAGAFSSVAYQAAKRRFASEAKRAERSGDAGIAR